MLNENIRKYRKECGLSQEEMAVKLHVVRQTISKWETNLNRNTAFEGKICWVFRVSHKIGRAHV